MTLTDKIQPLAGDLPVLAADPPPCGDPFAALDQLLVVVEALCPAWPPRAPAEAGQTYRL